MFYLQKTMEISGSHKLKLNYDSPCSRVHGHNWMVTVYCKSDKLDENGMIVDFSKIKKVVFALDHEHINDHVTFNPTAELLAEWICARVPSCYKVDVEETKNNVATYVRDDA